MEDPLFTCLKTLLSNGLPQEWLVELSEQTTCQGPVVFIRIESGPKADDNRRLVCLVQLKPEEKHITVTANDITTKNVHIVGKAIKTITSKYPMVFPGFCLSLTECPLNCSSCPEAKEYYRDF